MAKKFSRKESLIKRLLEKHNGKVSTHGDYTFVSALSAFPNSPEKTYCLFVWRGCKEDYIFANGWSEKRRLVDQVVRYKIAHDEHVENMTIRKKEFNAKKENKASSVGEGAILYRSCGYDQTNVDFVQVISIKSKFQRMVAPIHSQRTNESSDLVVPLRDSTKGELELGVITPHGISVNGETYRPWDGKPCYATHPYNYR